MGNELRFRPRRAVFVVLAASAAVVTAALVVAVSLPDSPEEVTKRFLRARYARNSQELYALASAADRAERSLAEFSEINPPFPESFQYGVDGLADAIQFLSTQVDQTGDQARLTVRALLPNSTDSDLYHLLHASEADQAFDGVSSPRQLMRRIRTDARLGLLPMVEVTEVVDLIREGRRWRVIMGWDANLQVTLEADIADGIPLQFKILTDPELWLRRGEMGDATFSVRNNSDESLRVVATHMYSPAAAQLHVDLIQCFCFVEERLDPDETRELSLVFRLGWDVPATTDKIKITYHYDLAPEGH